MDEEKLENKEETPQKQKNIVALRGAKQSGKKSREALHKILTTDEEYANMEDHVIIDHEIEKKLDENVREETRLTSVDNIMKLVYLDVQGYGLGAIANEMALSSEDVQLIRRSEAFKSAKDAVMAEIIATSRRMIEVSTIKAVKTLTECMNSHNEKIKLSAAVEVLNRTGLNATQKIELTTTNNNMMNFSEDELAEIIRGSVPVDAEVVTDGNK